MGVTKVKEPKDNKEAKKSPVKKKEVVKEKKVKKAIEGVRGIVRIAEIDLDGNKKLRNSLLRIKWVLGRRWRLLLLFVLALTPMRIWEVLTGSRSRSLRMS
jgi:hypothetical protein